MLIGVAIDSIGNYDCLMREDSGLFFWSERTMTLFHGAKGSDTLQQKQKKKLVMYMLGLFLNLMLDIDENLSERCFFEGFVEAFSLAS